MCFCYHYFLSLFFPIQKDIPIAEYQLIQWYECPFYEDEKNSLLSHVIDISDNDSE
jgi:hypothetical protein